MPQPLDGFLLTAGLGTRMGPLSRVLPKPAWTLRGKPLLQWGADGLRRAGLLHLACNAHHLPERLKQAAGTSLEVCPEPHLLGSAGGLRHALGRAVDPLAVWNGDALAEVPWAAFIAEHKLRGAELSWLLVPHPGGPWNPVWLDAHGRVLPQGETGEGPYHFTGAALWGSAALALLPDGPSDTKRDILPRLQHHAGIVVAPFPWLDIGSPDHLIAAAAQIAPHEEGRLPGCYLHPEARLSGQFQRCVLGPGAEPPAAVQDANALWYGEAGRQIRLGLD
ncbi:MAG: NTP transferase domain-containing protein [Holophaga sp.]|nr:NTP transferase domain-containing protein [Holophaga sp.]